MKEKSDFGRDSFTRRDFLKFSGLAFLLQFVLGLRIYSSYTGHYSHCQDEQYCEHISGYLNL